MRRRLAIAALALSALSACGTPGVSRIALAGGPWRSTRLTGHPLVGVIWSVAEARPVYRRDLDDALRGARFRLLGEVHDNPDHHALQLDLLRGLIEAGSRPLLAFEQFDRDHDRDLQERMARGNVSAEEVAAAVRFDRKGWDWDYYRPLVETALRYGLPLRAANLSTAAARSIVRDGLSSLGAERVAALRLEDAWSAAREQALREVVFDGHCRALPERLLPAMAAAQRARDATLAEALLDSGPDGAVLIAGNGHVRRDLGVPLYLPAARGRSCAVGMLEVEEGKDEPGDYFAQGAGVPPEYDVVCFTPRQERPDPCAAFKPRASSGRPEAY